MLRPKIITLDKEAERDTQPGAVGYLYITGIIGHQPGRFIAGNKAVAGISVVIIEIKAPVCKADIDLPVVAGRIRYLFAYAAIVKYIALPRFGQHISRVETKVQLPFT